MSSLGFLKSAMTQLRRHPASRNLPYALGRFASIRRGYGEALSALQSLGAVPGVRPVEGASLRVFVTGHFALLERTGTRDGSHEITSTLRRLGYAVKWLEPSPIRAARG